MNYITHYGDIEVDRNVCVVGGVSRMRVDVFCCNSMSDWQVNVLETGLRFRVIDWIDYVLRTEVIYFKNRCDFLNFKFTNISLTNYCCVFYFKSNNPMGEDDVVFNSCWNDLWISCFWFDSEMLFSIFYIKFCVLSCK